MNFNRQDFPFFVVVVCVFCVFFFLPDCGAVVSLKCLFSRSGFVPCCLAGRLAASARAALQHNGPDQALEVSIHLKSDVLCGWSRAAETEGWRDGGREGERSADR